MSPLTLRRYRAERMLRDQFTRLRASVLAGVRRQLRASGVSVDQADLEACYAQAWQGLYTTTLEGKQIANPTAWLMLVTFRRAIEEHRGRSRAELPRACLGAGASARGVLERGLETRGAYDSDLAAELDDRMQLRQLFEGLRGRLDGREREAATLCYLQGLSRAQAAARMGVSEARMRKLMDGRGAGQQGVAGKVGALVASIRDGDWCEQQGSLMRALAYGMLDPAGERYRLALMHHEQCPACRRYVACLRGLAVVLPPVLLPWTLAGGALARVGEGGYTASTAGAGGVSTGGAAAGMGSAGAGAGAGAGVAAGGGAAGVGAGGGWLLSGGLGAKLAVGCVLALGIGAGCIALQGGSRTRAPVSQLRHDRSRSDEPTVASAPGGYRILPTTEPTATSVPGARAAVRAQASEGSSASREFGPEQPSAARALSPSDRVSERGGDSARTASLGSGATASEASSGSSSASQAPASARGSARASAPQDSVAAEREFAPG
jgi:DNA-directed RNA polymerase specialized sigma24 family protein